MDIDREINDLSFNNFIATNKYMKELEHDDFYVEGEKKSQAVINKMSSATFCKEDNFSEKILFEPSLRIENLEMQLKNEKENVYKFGRNSDYDKLDFRNLQRNIDSIIVPTPKIHDLLFYNYSASEDYSKFIRKSLIDQHFNPYVNSTVFNLIPWYEIEYANGNKEVQTFSLFEKFKLVNEIVGNLNFYISITIDENKLLEGLEIDRLKYAQYGLLYVVSLITEKDIKKVVYDYKTMEGFKNTILNSSFIKWYKGKDTIKEKRAFEVGYNENKQSCISDKHFISLLEYDSKNEYKMYYIDCQIPVDQIKQVFKNNPIITFLLDILVFENDLVKRFNDLLDYFRTESTKTKVEKEWRQTKLLEWEKLRKIEENKIPKIKFDVDYNQKNSLLKTRVDNLNESIKSLKWLYNKISKIKYLYEGGINTTNQKTIFHPYLFLNSENPINSILLRFYKDNSNNNDNEINKEKTENNSKARAGFIETNKNEGEKKETISGKSILFKFSGFHVLLYNLRYKEFLGNGIGFCRKQLIKFEKVLIFWDNNYLEAIDEDSHFNGSNTLYYKSYHSTDNKGKIKMKSDNDNVVRDVEKNLSCVCIEFRPEMNIDNYTHKDMISNEFLQDLNLLLSTNFYILDEYFDKYIIETIPVKLKEDNTIEVDYDVKVSVKYNVTKNFGVKVKEVNYEGKIINEKNVKDQKEGLQRYFEGINYINDESELMPSDEFNETFKNFKHEEIIKDYRRFNNLENKHKEKEVEEINKMTISDRLQVKDKVLEIDDNLLNKGSDEGLGEVIGLDELDELDEF